MDEVAVEDDLVATQYRNGRVEVFGTNGKPVWYFPAGTATRGVALDEGRLIALTEQGVSVRSLTTGKVIRSHPLPHSGKNVALMDAEVGYAVYRSGRDLYLVRLSDGREVKLSVSGITSRYQADRVSLEARFGPHGLVVAHGRVIEVIGPTTLHHLLAAR